MLFLKENSYPTYFLSLMFILLSGVTQAAQLNLCPSEEPIPSIRRNYFKIGLAYFPKYTALTPPFGGIYTSDPNRYVETKQSRVLGKSYFLQWDRLKRRKFLDRETNTFSYDYSGFTTELWILAIRSESNQFSDPPKHFMEALKAMQSHPPTMTMGNKNTHDTVIQPMIGYALETDAEAFLSFSARAAIGPSLEILKKRKMNEIMNEKGERVNQFTPFTAYAWGFGGKFALEFKAPILKIKNLPLFCGVEAGYLGRVNWDHETYQSVSYQPGSGPKSAENFISLYNYANVAGKQSGSSQSRRTVAVRRGSFSPYLNLNLSMRLTK